MSGVNFRRAREATSDGKPRSKPKGIEAAHAILHVIRACNRPVAVGRYRLSKAAAEDLIGIALFGDEHFGIAQSNRYRDQLERRFTVLADQPLLYPAVDHLSEGYRRSVCGVHSIFYRIDGNDVKIIRVLKNQDLEKQL